jgi:hypothetical protein
MLNKTAAGNYVPLLALGLAAAVGGCSTQEDAQPDPFNQAPQIEAIYAHDSRTYVLSAGGAPQPATAAGLYDVQIWANPADPHYPNQTGENGQQNAANVSNFPASYNSIIVEFNTTLDGGKLGTVQNVSNASYCSSGYNPATAPIQILDVDNNSLPLIGSICYDPTSQLFRYPSLTFVLGSDSAFASSAKPFTCQAAGPDATFSAEDGSEGANRAAFKPSHHYAVAFTTTQILNENEIALTTPTAAPWSSGTFPFTTSGFDVMAVGYDDPNTGFYSYLSKPYLGFLKDCPENATFCNPVDGTFSAPNSNFANGLTGNIPMRIYLSLATTSALAAANIKLTRADGTAVAGTSVSASGARDHKMVYVIPPVTWEPGQSYVITVGANFAAADGTTKISAPATYSFTTSPGALGAVGVTPADGSADIEVYGGNGAAAPDQPSLMVLDFNAPVLGSSANTTNITLTGPNGPVAITVTPPTKGGHEIVFAPNAPLASSTSYTIQATGLTLDPAVAIPGVAAGATFPTVTATFKTSQFNALLDGSAFGGIYPIDNNPSLELGALNDAIFFDFGFSRAPKVSTVNSSNISLTEVNADGSLGNVVPPAIIAFSEPAIDAAGDMSPFLWQMVVTYSATGNNAYKVKCSQNYQLTFGTSIVDADETPVANLALEGCTSGDCSDVHTFTTAAFAPVPDAKGNLIVFAAGDPTAHPPTKDTFSINFPATLDHVAANAFINAGNPISLVDSSGNAVALTCPTLPADDSASAITCTANDPLTPNSTYTASAAILAASPLLISNTATIDTGTQDPVSMDEVYDHLPADQTTCQFAGPLLTSIVTGCTN